MKNGAIALGETEAVKYSNNAIAVVMLIPINPALTSLLMIHKGK